MKVDSYRFGEVVVDGKRYTSDVIIFPSRVRSGWWKKKGHQVGLEDVEEILQEKPEILVIGTGSSEGMRVLPETKLCLEEQGIELIVQATDEACQTYNQLCPVCKVAAALHLTC